MLFSALLNSTFPCRARVSLASTLTKEGVEKGCIYLFYTYYNIFLLGRQKQPMEAVEVKDFTEGIKFKPKKCFVLLSALSVATQS